MVSKDTIVFYEFFLNIKMAFLPIWLNIIPAAQILELLGNKKPSVSTTPSNQYGAGQNSTTASVEVTY
jgi:hypothetical protein